MVKNINNKKKKQILIKFKKKKNKKLINWSNSNRLSI